MAIDGCDGGATMELGGGSSRVVSHVVAGVRESWLFLRFVDGSMVGFEHTGCRDVCGGVGSANHQCSSELRLFARSSHPRLSILSL